jgi:hypothetical protein
MRVRIMWLPPGAGPGGRLDLRRGLVAAGFPVALVRPCRAGRAARRRALDRRGPAGPRVCPGGTGSCRRSARPRRRYNADRAGCRTGPPGDSHRDDFGRRLGGAGGVPGVKKLRTRKAIPAGKMIRCPNEEMPVRLGRALVLASLLLAPGCGDDGVDWKGVGTDGKARDSTAPAAGSHRSQTDGSK